jgi:hypothetical protein
MPKTYTAAGSATAGQVYTASAHNVIVTNVNNFIVPPSVSVYTTAATTTVANTTFTRLTWTTANHDTDSMKGAGTVNGLSIGTTGLYLVTCYAVFDANATGTRAIYLDKGTSSSITTIIGYGFGSPQNANFADVVATAVYPLTAGDFIQAFAWQNRGGDLNVLGNASNRAFTATWIGRTS